MNQPAAPLQNKHALAPGWVAFIGFVAHHADALGFVPAPFPVPLPALSLDTEGERDNG